MQPHIYSKGQVEGPDDEKTKALVSKALDPESRAFFVMDYQKHYRLLVLKALSRTGLTGYTEKHHILPRCMGGPDDPANLVELTGREHFVAHWLLHRKYPEHTGLRKAFCMMALCGTDNHQRYTPSSRAISEARENNPGGIEKTAISQYELNGDWVCDWPSINEAGRALNISPSHICKICKQTGPQKTLGGFQWRYANEPAPGPTKAGKVAGKPVNQYTKDGKFLRRFDTLSEAALSLNKQTKLRTLITSISRVCKGLKQSSQGYVWSFN